MTAFVQANSDLLELKKGEDLKLSPLYSPIVINLEEDLAMADSYLQAEQGDEYNTATAAQLQKAMMSPDWKTRMMTTTPTAHHLGHHLRCSEEEDTLDPPELGDTFSSDITYLKLIKYDFQ